MDITIKILSDITMKDSGKHYEIGDLVVVPITTDGLKTHNDLTRQITTYLFGQTGKNLWEATDDYQIENEDSIWQFVGNPVKYHLVYSDFGETCDMHVHSVGLFESEAEARHVAIECMREYVDDHTLVADTDEVIQPTMDEVNLECWMEHGSEGCCWTILKVNL